MNDASRGITLEEALADLEAAADPSRLAGMARVGIVVSDALGVGIPSIRAIAKRAGRDDALAADLWSTGIHEARILAAHVADPATWPRARAEVWVAQIDSWDVGDAAADLFAATPYRDDAIAAWSVRPEPYVKRCAFAMIARTAVRDGTAGDDLFVDWFPTIRAGARDDRNEVKKGVSWALRQIGKRNAALHAAAVEEAHAMLEEALRDGSRGERWVARDVLRELRHPDHLRRLGLA